MRRAVLAQSSTANLPYSRERFSFRAPDITPTVTPSRFRERGRDREDAHRVGNPTCRGNEQTRASLSRWENFSFVNIADISPFSLVCEELSNLRRISNRSARNRLRITPVSLIQRESRLIVRNQSRAYTRIRVDVPRRILSSHPPACSLLFARLDRGVY